ncbi:hypothetical protein BDQ17DRAFT_1414400 [Cyathus striatus]|nr:hypothetical protein BDQ17DRAFT_1414400 [Cyathus striatus]
MEGVDSLIRVCGTWIRPPRLTRHIYDPVGELHAYPSRSPVGKIVELGGGEEMCRDEAGGIESHYGKDVIYPRTLPDHGYTRPEIRLQESLPDAAILPVKGVKSDETSEMKFGVTVEAIKDFVNPAHTPRMHVEKRGKDLGPALLERLGVRLVWNKSTDLWRDLPFAASPMKGAARYTETTKKP